MPYAVLVAVALVGASYALSGVRLLLTARARAAGGLLAVAGGTALAVVVVYSASLHGAADTLSMFAMLLTALALTTYPSVRWQTVVDAVALALVSAAPLLLAAAILWQADPGTRFSGEALVAVVVLVLILHTWWRLERYAAERWALSWMALSVGAALLAAGLVLFAAPSTLAVVVACVVFALVGPALYVGVARPEVVDVRHLVVTVVVLATALLAYMALFVCVTAFLEVIGGHRPSPGAVVLVAALCGMAFHPIQSVLRGVVEELLFGHRPDPLGAALHVAGHLGADPVLALRAIREAMVLPYARVTVDDVPLATSGVAVGRSSTVPLRIGQDRLGELEVGLRPGESSLTAADERVLRLVAPLLAQNLYARTLAADLKVSRAGTVQALEEERRRLRRDLHDGLGPRLSGIGFTADAARNSLRHDPDAAEQLLQTLRGDAVAAMHEIRQLVYDMRPPALDELGLVGALRQQAAGMRTANGQPLRVAIDAEEPEGLSAAVEVAAYRIVVEALTNAARHSGSDRADVRLHVADDVLEIEVRDGGSFTEGWTEGVGLSSMGERALEVGGTLALAQGPGGGCARAVLPLTHAVPKQPR
ncbi:MAG: sensor histidine kinase [Actinomycetes bacterium]